LAGSSTLRALLFLAWPVLIEQSLSMLIMISERWLTGNFLPAPKFMAAVTLVTYVLGFLTGLYAAVAIGALALVARMVGAGDTVAARRATNQALTLGLMIVAGTVAIGLLLGRWGIERIGLHGSAASLAASYLKILVIGLPAMMLSQVGMAALRGAGDTVTGLVAMIFQNAVNILVGFGLVSGWGPFPNLGWTGLAIGAVCGYWTAAAIVLARLLIGRYGLWIEWGWLRPDLGLIRRLLRIGIPGGVDALCVSLCQFWFLSIVTRLGNVSMAAFGIAITIEALAFLPGSAFQVASTTLAGQYLGAGDPRRAARSVWMACGACSGLMTVVAIGFFIEADWLTRQFVADGQTEAGRLAAVLVRIVAFGQLPQAFLMVFSGALRGVGDTRATLAISFVGFLLVRIPLAYLLAWSTIDIGVGPWHWTLHGFGWGVEGAWYAMVSDMLVRGLLSTGRFCQGGWKRIEV